MAFAIEEAFAPLASSSTRSAKASRAAKAWREAAAAVVSVKPQPLPPLPATPLAPRMFPLCRFAEGQEIDGWACQDGRKPAEDAAR